MATPKGLDELGDAVRQTIRAYHGSPYDFDRFDASKIGAGEGHQSYGHGLYFAGNEAVGKHYRDSLKDVLDKDAPHDLLEEEAWAHKQWLEAYSKESEWDRPASGLSNLAKEFGEPNPHSQAVADAFSRLLEVRGRLEQATKNPGRMYEVEIGYPEESLLNWDRPAAPTGGVGGRAAEVLRAVRPQEIDVRTLEYIQRMRPGDYAPPSYGSPVDNVERALQKLALDRDGATELRRAGIPGVRYLDGVSRAEGAGSRNYVVFPGAEDQIRILRKY